MPPIAPIHQAIIRRNVKKAKRMILQDPSLLEERTDRDLTICVDYIAYAGSPPLLLSVIQGDEKMVEWLINQGCNIQARSQRGFDAFLLACKHDRVAVASLLLQRGANLKTRTPVFYGWTPLMLAAEEGHVEMIHFLLDVVCHEDLDVQAKNDATTALHRSCWDGHSKATKILLDAGTDGV